MFDKIFFYLLAIIVIISLPAIAFAEWVDVDQSGQESINVTNTAANSDQASLAFNPITNLPAIAWTEGIIGVAEVYFLQWNGTEWVDADGTGQESANVSNNAGDSFTPSLAFNPSTGLPSIAWGDDTSGNAEIYYLQWNGFSWVDADGIFQDGINISNAGASSLEPRLAYNTTSNYPVIAWTDAASGDYEIRYLQWNGSAWVDADGSGQVQIEIVSNLGTSTDPALIMDDNDLPVISWVDNSTGNYEIYFLRWNGSSWVDADGVGQESINISQTAGDNDYDPDVALISNQPVVVWNCEISSADEICLLQWNGSSWVDADGVGQGSKNVSNNSGNSLGPRLSINDNNEFLLSWYDDSDGGGTTDIYFLQWNGSSWVDADGTGQESVSIINNNASSSYPSMDYRGSTGYPAIAWRDEYAGNTEIFYLEWMPEENPPINNPDNPGGETLLPETGYSSTLIEFINKSLGIN